MTKLYILNYEEKKTSIYPNDFNVSALPLDSLFNLILTEKSLKTNIFIYTYSLHSIKDFFDKQLSKDDYTINTFTFQDVLYSMEYSYVLQKRKRKIIIKDLYHFLSSDILTHNPSEDFISFNLLENELLKEYKININTLFVLSTPSIALKIFKKHYNKEYKMIPNLTSEQDSFIRKSYFGGRNEVFSPINGENYYYDVNSLYPFIMKNYKMPCGYPVYKDENYFKDIKITKDMTFFGFLDVLIIRDNNGNNMPVLPFRMLDKKESAHMGIIYPSGIFRCVYFSEELKLALNSGYKIIKVFGGYEYTHNAIIFNDFVEDLYNKRLNAKNKITNDFYKKLLNTLYGRFGVVFEKLKKNVINNVELSGDIFVDDTAFIPLTSHTCYNNVGISSAIASYARIYMYTILQKENIKPLYIDTDGLFISKPLPEYLVTANKELGKFRLESHNSNAYFLANKFYFYKTYEDNSYIHKFKGISRKYQIYSFDEVINTFKQILHVTDKKSSFIFRLRILDENKNISVYTFKTERKRKLIKKNNIWSTVPWCIKQIN